LVQSSKLGLLDFRAALLTLTANKMSVRVQIASYSILPMALLYFVSLNFLSFNSWFSFGNRFFFTGLTYQFYFFFCFFFFFFFFFFFLFFIFFFFFFFFFFFSLGYHLSTLFVVEYNHCRSLQI